MKNESTRNEETVLPKPGCPAPTDPNHPFIGLAPSDSRAVGTRSTASPFEFRDAVKSVPTRETLVEFRERLVTLCDGRPGLRGALQIETRLPSASETGSADSPAPAIIDFLASTEALDRYHEIIVPSGWRLEAYRRNPVFQNAHQYGDIIFTLGKALITEVRPLGPGGEVCLFQRVEFAVGANPMARIAYGLYRGKFLNAVSVGFIPLRWENGGEEAGYRRRYLEQELLEVSAVGIPANPEALQLGLKAGAIEKSDLQELAELCSRTLGAAPGGASQTPSDHATGQRPNDFCGNTAVPNADTSAWGVRNNGAQLLQLARALRALLRRT